MSSDLSTPSVTRTVQLDAETDDVWQAIADPEQRARWLDDDDAAARTVRLDSVEDGRRLVWTWWRPDGDEPDASTVEIAISPRVGGGTQVVVTETPLRATPVSASASASGTASALAARHWDHRLLGLELLFVAAGACVF
jgi:uncharacterized protein YndB with AHSA1/START domain